MKKLIPHKFVPHIWSTRSFKDQSIIEISGVYCVKCEIYAYKDLPNVIKDLERLNRDLKKEADISSRVAVRKLIHHTLPSGEVLEKEGCIISDADFIVQDILT